MKTGKIAIAVVLIVIVAGIAAFFLVPGLQRSVMPETTGFFELGFTKNQLAMIGGDIGLTEREKMLAIKNNFFAFSFGDAEKKQVVEQEKLEIKQGGFESPQGTLLEGWILRVPGIERGKTYQYEIRLPDYEISTGQFTASDVQ
ncbi:MAG: hypothetical protein PHH08_03990 [Candidatus ainarchaeum sp.]|nr:hypothetical protein [Candidatus ainarchaeum sp.]